RPRTPGGRRQDRLGRAPGTAKELHGADGGREPKKHEGGEQEGGGHRSLSPASSGIDQRHERKLTSSQPPSIPMIKARAYASPTTVACLLFTLVTLLSFNTPALCQQSPVPGLDEYITKALHDWEVPGLALAIVKNDSVIYMKGYGVRKLGTEDKVDEKTMFA